MSKTFKKDKADKMNGCDIFVIGIIALFTLTGIYRGFICVVIRTLSAVISTAISMIFYPLVCGIVRQTPFYTGLKDEIILRLGLRDMAVEATKQGQGMLIDSLPVQPIFKEKLMVNNNSVIYDILGVDNIVDYIGGFLANIALNIIVSISLFAVSYIVIRLILTAAELIGKAPVIRTAERVGGGLVGFSAAVIFIWALFAVLDMFVTQPFFSALYDDIQQSVLASGFYNTNLIRAILLERMF